MPLKDNFKSTQYIWKDSWIPSKCIIFSDERTYRDIMEKLKYFPNSYYNQFVRKLKYLGSLNKPISNKNYMYQIDAGYYENYIFGKNSDYRLAFDWNKDKNGNVLISILGITNHKGIKKRKFKEDLEDNLDEEDIHFIGRYL